MAEPLRDWYVTAMLRRWQANSPTRRDEVRGPGIDGLLGSSDHPGVSLIISDDCCFEVLAEIVGDACSGYIQVFREAARCLPLLEAAQPWTGSPQAAMVLRDLTSIRSVGLPSGVTVRPVRRLPEDPVDGVPLSDAVATAVRASPGEDADGLEASLVAMPGIVLFAALGRDGTVCATSGFQLAEDHARIIMIDTDPAWRRRGLGAAMTAHALSAARSQGATHATLDASALGRPVYARLGFETVAETMRFTAAAD